MAAAHDSVDQAIREIDRLRQTLKKSKSTQVRSIEEKALIKATSLAWFNNHRRQMTSLTDGDLVRSVDDGYKALISSTDRASTRASYDSIIKSLRRNLTALREETLSTPIEFEATANEPPDFAKLVSDSNMRKILERRWIECYKCIRADAPLAATVMMGGLLEALILARVHREPNKAAIFGAALAPKDKDTGKTKPLNEWGLRNYIDVAHELKWISHSAKDVGEVLRDYRNYVHPQKELSHGVDLTESDASLFWEISKNIARQLL